MNLQRFVVHAVALYAGLLLAPAFAQSVGADSGSVGQRTAAAHRTAEHERIRREREALQAQQKLDESACYQRFAVEDCLRRVRAGMREAETRLRAQEIELNDAERKEKAAERLRIIEEKQHAAPVPLPAASDGAILRNAPKAAKGDAGTLRDQEAAQRAQEQRSRVQKQTQEQAARATENAQRAAEARERHARTLEAAQERRARAEKARADAAAQGRVPAAPLPTASAAR